MAVVGTIILVAAALVIARIVMAEQRRLDANVRAWRAVARELGLDDAGDENALSMRGRLNGVPVFAEFVRQTRQAGKVTTIEEKTRFYAGESGRIPASLIVRRDSIARSLGRLVAGSDETIGDAAFDEVVELPALDAQACAALTSDARRQLRELMQRGGEVREGAVICEPDIPRTHEPRWLIEMLRFSSRLAAKLDVAPGALHEQLAHNAIYDPSPGVRLQNIRFLADPATRTPPDLLVATARKLLADRHAPLRLWAATEVDGIDEEGTAVLVALATDAQLEAKLRIEALRALADGDGEDLQALLTSLCIPLLQVTAQGSPELARAALALVAEMRLDVPVAAVIKCSTSPHEALRVAALGALAALEAPGAEGILTNALSDPSSDVQCAGAEGLGVIGSVAAVEPLLPLTRGIGRAPLRRAARAAIAQIQSRLGDVEAGRVSLAEGADLAGAVALAETSDETLGAVSLADDAEPPARTPTR